MIVAEGLAREDVAPDRAMVVFAHPDDAEFTSGGTVAKWAGEVYLFGSDQPDVWVDVTGTFARKLAAIAAHCSQTASLVDVVEATRRCNRDYGRACGCEHAEAVKVLRPSGT